eukprot:CAMPEP_0172498778 /NCGR_PEP_ID=MMETSP1066-20121228/117281_1 /TAXON_ID=671091 /ORGANISM="Coscinodiscus wailesii, Strain CCMP2513" /LENGTH=249 /DNA_ID=CAMNT_0013272203 /DNA_START=82 /DNA_END=831 /DNA_ORIENTATION=+
MNLSLTVLAAYYGAALTSAFQAHLPQRTFSTVVNTRQTAMRMSAATEKVPIVVTGNNIEVTPALMDYVNTKVERTLGKLSSNGWVRECDVHLTVNKNPKVKDSHKAEVVTIMKGMTIRAAEESPDMYASIDFVTDRLARKLVKYKERKLDGYHGGPNVGENMADVLAAIDDDIVEAADETDEYVDQYAPEVTKIKSFDLSKPISVEEAIFALDYIDHDFYVFRDEKTNEISVVYKRNAGGVGLIQPQGQ